MIVRHFSGNRQNRSMIQALSIAVTVIGIVCTQRLEAQDSKINTNLGVGMTVPLNPTAQIVGSSH